MSQEAWKKSIWFQVREKRDAAETKEARDAASSMLKVFKHLGESVMIFLFPKLGYISFVEGSYFIHD